MGEPYEIVAWENPTGTPGRCMRAVKEYSGEVPVVFRETPLAHAASQEDVCDTCLKALTTDVDQCSACKSVSYCNTKCQKAAWRGWHKKECKMMASLREEQGVKPTPTLLMTFRTLLACDGDLKHEFLSGLVHHLATMSQKRRDMYAQLTVLLNSMLKRAGMDELSMQDALELFAKLEVNSFSILSDTFSTVGQGIYKQASVVNHSCQPNMTVSFSGREMIAMPIKDIKAGEELTVSYVELASLAAERNDALQARYGFRCKCDRCEGDARSIEEEHDPARLVKGNEEISALIEKEKFEEALVMCMELLPSLDLYGDTHPMVGLHWLNVARLKWHFEDTEGTYEVCGNKNKDDFDVVTFFKAVCTERQIHFPASRCLSRQWYHIAITLFPFFSHFVHRQHCAHLLPQAGMMAVAILKLTVHPNNALLLQAADITSQAHRLKNRTGRM